MTIIIAPVCLLFLNRQSSTSGKTLLLDLKTTCMKENTRMAVSILVPSIIPVLKLLILSQQTWRFRHSRNSLFSQLTAHAVSPEPPWWHQQHNTRALPSREALGRAAVSPASGVLMEKAAAGALQLKPVVASLPCRILIRYKEVCCSLPSPGGHNCAEGPAAPSTGRPSAGLTVKEILTYQRLGGRVV